ncbi:lipopolysaccharide-induced tumor necrosis factor-alpha factor homolog isoform X2 [Convolutriloba macropyga]
MAAANSPGGPAYPYPASGNQPQGQAPYPMPPAPGGGQYPGQQPNQAPPAQPYYAAPPPPVPGVVQPPAYPAYQPVTVTPGFAAAGQQPPVVVFNPATAVGHNPTTLRCPHCSAQVTTDVTYEAEGSTWLMCLIIFGTGCLFTILLLIGFFLWFVCFVPFCIKECKAAIHTCPNCKTEIARKRPKYLS